MVLGLKMDLTSVVSSFVALEPMSIITLLLITAVSYKHNQLTNSLKDLHVKNSKCLDSLQERVTSVEKDIIAIEVRDKTIQLFISELREDMNGVYRKLEEVRVEIVKTR